MAPITSWQQAMSASAIRSSEAEAHAASSLPQSFRSNAERSEFSSACFSLRGLVRGRTNPRKLKHALPGLRCGGCFAQQLFHARDVFRHIDTDRIVLRFGDANLVSVFHPAQLFELLDP